MIFDFTIGHILTRTVYSVFTLYMILILLRWLGPWLLIDMQTGRWRWVGQVTDPFVQRIRKVVPTAGPLDFGPIAATLIVWFLREVAVRVILQASA